MAKPIFIIDMAFNGVISPAMNDYMDRITKTLNDYHVIINIDGSLKESKYQMFSDKEIDPIELEALKEKLTIPIEFVTTKESIIFVASDGRQFDDELTCGAYQCQLNRTQTYDHLMKNRNWFEKLSILNQELI